MKKHGLHCLCLMVLMFGLLVTPRTTQSASVVPSYELRDVSPNVPACSKALGSQLTGFSLIINIPGTGYFVDLIKVDGIGVVGNEVYSHSGQVLIGPGYFVVDVQGYSVPANTRITVASYSYADPGRTNLVYITSMMFDCTTGKIIALCSGTPANYTKCTAASNAPTAPQFFDPGDIRVDGWANDRLALYCRSEKEIMVIGIGSDGNAAGYALFDPKAVIAAGKTGLYVPLRSYHTDAKVDLGVVSIQMILNDGVTSFYVAWNGGILNATGQGDFKKQFVIPIRFCPYTFR